MLTVGYGDITPSNGIERLFTVKFIIIFIQDTLHNSTYTILY